MEGLESDKDGDRARFLGIGDELPEGIDVLFGCVLWVCILDVVFGMLLTSIGEVLFAGLADNAYGRVLDTDFIEGAKTAVAISPGRSLSPTTIVWMVPKRVRMKKARKSSGSPSVVRKKEYFFIL